jgi:hypothetical protein
LTGNSALPLAVTNLWDLRGGEIWTRIEAYFHTPALRAKTLTDHEAIVAALEAHDADGAREAMHRHLRRVAREFQRRWDETGGGTKPGEPRGEPTRKSTHEGQGGTVAPLRAPPQPDDIDRPASQSGSNTAGERASARALHKPGGDS